MNLSWQRRRNAFSHAWLKNRYIPSLRKWLNVLDGSVEDREFEEMFISSVLLEWRNHGAECTDLLRTFSLEMSPRKLIKWTPDDDWLPELIDLLWFARCGVRTQLNLAKEALDLADKTYGVILGIISQGTILNASEFLPYRHIFSNFCELCHLLANRIDQFPSEIKPV